MVALCGNTGPGNEKVPLRLETELGWAGWAETTDCSLGWAETTDWAGQENIVTGIISPQY